MQEEPIIENVKAKAEKVLAEAPPDPKAQVERLQAEGLLVTGLTDYMDHHLVEPLVEEDTP